MTTNRSITEPDARTDAGCEFFGASVVGAEHRRLKQRREDAWRGAFSGPQGGACVAVADGMGSCREARRGAEKAVGAATRMFRRWNRAPGVEAAWLVRGLESEWRLDAAPADPRDCASTCLLAGWSPDSGLVVCGLGDGLILLRERDGETRVLSARPDGDALNETRALGRDHRMSDWVVRTHVPTAPWVVLLATDGVADDLRADRLEGFITWVSQELAPLPAAERARLLRKTLREWPTPCSGDDKTIAVLFSR